MKNKGGGNRWYKVRVRKNIPLSRSLYTPGWSCIVITQQCNHSSSSSDTTLSSHRNGIISIVVRHYCFTYYMVNITAMLYYLAVSEYMYLILSIAVKLYWYISTSGVMLL